MSNISLTETTRRILIIDDNHAIHQDLRKILLGDANPDVNLLSDEKLLFDLPTSAVPVLTFEIDSAYQGRDGLTQVQAAIAENKPYAMAFVDVRMPPGWDGIETISHLWQADPNLQVVICTAFSDYSWKDIQASLAQSDNLLILKKPFDSIEVIQLAYTLTRKWLTSHQARARMEDLDLMVARRTAELDATNQSLKKEFAERAKAEEAFRVVFSASPIGIALLNEELRAVSSNLALERLHGLDHHDIIDKDPVELEWFPSNQELQDVVSDTRNGGGIDQREIRLKHAALGFRTGLLWARHVEIGEARHLLCFVLDISERVEMEQDLRRARIAAEAAAKAKSEFLANMSHEIRTPLNGVLGLSSFLDEETLPESVRALGQLIRSSGEMLRRVLDDVLDFSKIDSGKLELEHEPFSLREALAWSIGIYRKTALDKNLELNLHIGDDVPDCLMGDTTRLRQVLTNLISNGLKFTERGSVDVYAAVESPAGDREGCRLRMSVSDTGIGIPADRMDRLFQSFSQIDASTNRRFGGTGLGLAICKRLIEMMDGQLTVESAIGAGTKFRFTLPIQLAEPMDALVGENPEYGIPRKVLVVEDNAVNRMVTKRLLEKLGHEVDVVCDGESAIRRVQEAQWDLVLMDVNMPGIDGLQATRFIRNSLVGRGLVPIVALTASATADDRNECLTVGMNDFLSKPICLEALRKVIERWTSGPSQPIILDRHLLTQS